jgi:hypothetical protein
MRTRTIRPRTLGLALLTLLTALPSTAGAGGLRATKEADWYRHPSDAKYYTESWTTLVYTADGHFLNINFVYSNIGVVSGNTSVNVAVTKPGAASATHIRRNHGTGDYAENRGTARIVIGKNSMTLRGRELHLIVKEEGIDLELTVTAWTDGVVWGDGKVYVDDAKKEWMQTFFHIPRGDARGTATVGGQTFSLEGAAYMDHSLQNVLATDFSARWWTLRLFGAEDSLAFITFRTTKERGGKLFGRGLWVRRDGVVAVAPKVRVTPGGPTKDPKGHTYDTRYRFAFSGAGGAVEGTVASAGLLDREAFMEDLNWLERQVAEMVAGNPITYRMRGKPTVTLKPKGGAARTVDGPAVIESVVMRAEEGKEAAPAPAEGDGKADAGKGDVGKP